MSEWKTPPAEESVTVSRSRTFSVRPRTVYDIFESERAAGPGAFGTYSGFSCVASATCDTEAQAVAVMKALALVASK